MNGENANDQVADKASSDYGDDQFDDLDDDTLMELDASLNLCPVDDATLVMEEIAPVPPAPPPPPQVLKVAEDDFGDFDDDVFDGAEDLMAAVEARHIPQPQQPKFHGQQHNRLPLVNVETEDDPYGDDFGNDLDLEAIEFAATQSAMRAPSAVSHVRKAL